MNLGDWSNFYIASAGAAAALAGLVIVAISVNINHILEYAHLPVRAAAAISSLILILISSLTGLFYDMTTHNFGLIVILATLLAYIFGLKVLVNILSKNSKRGISIKERLLQIAITQLGLLMFLVSGILLTIKVSTGFTLLAYSILIVFISSVFNAWVLLVEILR
jgi:modulator of FtsH protease